MVFSDLFFLFVFIPAFVAVYLLCALIDRKVSGRNADGADRKTGHLWRNIALTIFSLLFYAWGEPVYVFLMLICVLVNYLAGLGIGRSTNHKKLWLVIGVALDLAILGTFKYAGFLAHNLSAIGLSVPDPKISLPIGISFYIFQSVSYLVDVYRGDAPMQKSYGGLLLYISMFPQLIAGPIVRYNTVAKEIHERHVTARDIADGVFRFLIGLAKKVIIANQLSEIVKTMIGGDMSHLTTAGAWIGIIAFVLQIYFDFSGYSDMAIGIGRCLGFHFCENFDHPYTSRTITEFWRRWHMSLGSFFRDYVYIPMGGNRKHMLLNIMVVWFLTGLWHGAAWNFALWGLYFGVILTIEKYTIRRIEGKIPAPLLHFYALFIVTVGFVFFYFDNGLSDIGTWFTAAFGGANELANLGDENMIFSKFWLWMAAIILCMPVRRKVSEWADRRLVVGTTAHGNVVMVSRIVASAAIILLAVALLVGATNNPFLYTRF